MAITVAKDKERIQSILSNDPYLINYLGFSPKEIYRVKATDTLLGTSSNNEKLKQQIFIFNVDPEATINPIIKGIVYEVDVSVPFAKNGTGDLAIEQVQALLIGAEITPTHELELLDPPLILPSETSLYQIGVRFVCYESIYTKTKKYVKEDVANGNS